jgi:hypothetical protein
LDQAGENPDRISDFPAKVWENPANISAIPAKVWENPANISAIPAKVCVNPANISVNPAKIFRNLANISVNPANISPQVARNRENASFLPTICPNYPTIRPQKTYETALDGCFHPHCFTDHSPISDSTRD